MALGYLQMPWPGILDLLPFDLSLHNHGPTSLPFFKTSEDMRSFKRFHPFACAASDLNYHLPSVLTFHMGWISIKLSPTAQG